MLFFDHVDDLHSDDCVEVLFSAGVLDLLVRVLEQVLVSSEPTDRVELGEECDILHEEREEDERIDELPLVVCVKLVEMLSEVVDPALDYVKFKNLLKGIVDAENLKKPFVGVTMNDFGVRHDIPHVVYAGVGQIVAELGPEPLYGYFKLADGGEGPDYYLPLLVVKRDHEVLLVALETELLVRPKSVVHGLDKVLCPGVVIGLSAYLFVENHMDVLPLGLKTREYVSLIMLIFQRSSTTLFFDRYYLATV